MTTRSQTNTAGHKVARLYRMVMEDHVCPYGIKSKWLLERHGYVVEDNHLTTREETDDFKNEVDVETTPQTFIGETRIGGYDDLRAHFAGKPADDDATTYVPVIVIFATCALMAMTLSYGVFGTVLTLRCIEWFAAFSMTALAIQKLRDVESFSTMFLNYDLLARRWVPYAYLYAYGEAAAGILMIGGGTLGAVGAPIALFIGT
ncbi:MAG: glutaredoxin, partial [Gammaproteobacteria bacterium]|nr:glutaredoxin [Gammaproteobacteria bacterium]